MEQSLPNSTTVIGRVARRIWAVAMRDKYGANERSQKLKYHSMQHLHAFGCAGKVLVVGVAKSSERITKNEGLSVNICETSVNMTKIGETSANVRGSQENSTQHEPQLTHTQ